MSEAVAIALKEWAAVCEALRAGRQIIVLRKGGIAERSGQFHLEHGEFWLLPTYFHERPEALKLTDRAFFAAVAAAPPADRVRIDLFARVAELVHLDRPEQLERLSDTHVYGAETVGDRFRYRKPGLWLLALRVYQAPAIELPLWPELAGCHSWVELPQPLAIDAARSVLDDDRFAQRMAELHALVG